MSTKSFTVAGNTKAPLSRTGSNENNTNNNNNTNATDKKQQQIKYIASVVRALVNSRKPPCTLREILREYPEVENKPIPFKQLGFNSSEDLLRESGEFIFNRIGGETCITTKHNTKTAHIASMVRSQKSSKSTRINTQVKQQVRQPRRSDQSWNKSTFSSNIFQKLPPASNRFIESQNRANKAHNNNKNNSNNNNNNNNYQNNNRNNNNNSNNAQQQQLQRQKSTGVSANNNNKTNSAGNQQSKDLREVINAKVQQSSSNNNNNNKDNNKNNIANGQKDLRNLLNQKSQEQQKTSTQQQQKMQNGNKVDLRERLNSKQQQQQNTNMPRAILGQNNGGINGSTAAANLQKQQQQQLLQNNTAIAIASSLILAQREQKNQEQRHQNRAELLSYQQQQQQQQQQRSSYKQSVQHHQQQQQQQQPQQLTPAAAAAAKYKNNGASVGAITNGIANCSVQQRLSVRINNNNNSNNNRTAFAGSGYNSETSPASSSSGFDDSSVSPFSDSQPPQFNKPRYMQKKQQQHQTDEPVIPPKVFQFNPKLDPITSLSQYCVVRKCAKPEYTILKPKFSNFFTGRVYVNGSMFSTYPKEYQNEHMAKIACALQAIEQIKAQEYRRPLPPCTDTDYELTEKIYNELLAHPHGMFAKNMTEWFESTYKQALPAHWWSLVQSSNRFITETAASNNVILFANLDFDKDEAESLTDLTTNTVIQMDGITLPWSQKCWNLYITHCASTIEVWARLFGKDYSEQFDSLMSEIEMSMLNDKVRPLAISNKQIYLVCISDCWHRVRVEEMDKLNGTALCFFIDFGDADWLSVSQLYICDPKFLKLPSQAVPFSLFGLEDFAGNPYARRNLDLMLASKSVVGEILTKEADFYASDAAKVQVVLYDTSSQDDINLHPLILNAICDDTPPPKLNPTGVTNVQVSYVSDEGDLYLQILNSELKYVQKLVQQLIESKFKRDQHKVTRDDLKRSNLFLICEESSDSDDAQPLWYRGALTERHYLLEDEEFDIFYVDNGQTRRTHISKIFRLESLSTALSKFPRQAIKARLHNIPKINKSIVGRMRALLPANCEALVKLVTPNTVPYITAYRRIGGSDTLSTINDVIRIEHELEISSSDAADGGSGGGSTSPSDTTINANGGGSSASTASLSPRTTNSFVDVTRGLTITCATSVPNSPQKSGELPKLKTYDAIPPIGDFFEVRVTMSSNPSNFTIQPYKSYPKLRTMMKELQEYCENNDDFIPVDMVEIGQAYAAKNPDGYYHRVTVVNTYSGEMIHVCFCDFGDIAILRSDQLKILPAKFRVLPKMALQAKLHGISARHVDWTLDDCLRFRELTVGLKFVSIIQSISHDKLGAPDAQILELDLVDVTTDEDIYIHELLLKEDRAIIDDAAKKAAIH